MEPALLQPVAILAALLGLAGAVLGLLGVLSRRSSALRWRMVGLAFAGVLACCAAGAGAVGLSARLWLPVLALALVLASVHALQSGAPLALLLRPRLPWGLLLVAAPAAAVWCFAHLLCTAQVLPFQPDDSLWRTWEEVAEVHAATDAGRPVPVYRSHYEAEEKGGGRLTDANTVREWTAKLIRTAPPDATHNCHGWVYTGGHHWIQDRHVEMILADNGYQPVSEPQAGDVITYRDADGTVLHSGLVRVVEPGLVLIESKWGPLGRYLHRPEEQNYGLRFTYYRSQRKGHILRGIGGMPSGIESPAISRR